MPAPTVPAQRRTKTARSSTARETGRRMRNLLSPLANNYGVFEGLLSEESRVGAGSRGHGLRLRIGANRKRAGNAMPGATPRCLTADSRGLEVGRHRMTTWPPQSADASCAGRNSPFTTERQMNILGRRAIATNAVNVSKANQIVQEGALNTPRTSSPRLSRAEAFPIKASDYAAKWKSRTLAHLSFLAR